MGKSVYKKAERLQERLARQKQKEIKQSILTLGWIFEKWYEKLILVILIILGIWKLFGLIFF